MIFLVLKQGDFDRFQPCFHETLEVQEPPFFFNTVGRCQPPFSRKPKGGCFITIKKTVFFGGCFECWWRYFGVIFQGSQGFLGRTRQTKIEDVFGRFFWEKETERASHPFQQKSTVSLPLKCHGGKRILAY